MKALNLTIASFGNIEKPVVKPRAKDALAEFESRPDVRDVFARVQNNDGFSLAAARKAFTGVHFKKK